MLGLLVFGHSAPKPWFIYRPIYVGDVVEKVALRQVFFPVFLFSLLKVVALMFRNDSFIARLSHW
jgi:hypothetical protein